MPFLLLMMIVLIHELGHFLCAVFLHIPVDKICLYPFGGISKFKNKLNIPLKHEFLILIMGPLMQIVFMFLIKDHLPLSYQEMFVLYNRNILVFNLLPIYPLDGGKLLNIILASQLSFKKSLTLSLYFSTFVIAFLFFFLLKNMKLNLFLLLFLLLFRIYEEYRKRKIYQEKFLLERYLEPNIFKKRCKVSTVSDFRRDYQHLVKGKVRYYTEKEILEKKFNHQQSR